MSKAKILLLLVAVLFCVSGCKPANPIAASAAKERAQRAKNEELIKKQNKLVEETQKMMNMPVPNPTGSPNMPKVGVPPELQPPSGAPAPFIPDIPPDQGKK
jgi:hypothetical protein